MQPHASPSDQPPQPPRAAPRHAPRNVLTWALRCLAVLPLGYALAVAVLGTMPRPTDRVPVPACCPPGGAVRSAAEQQGIVPGGKGAGMAEADTRNAPPVTIHVVSNGVHADIVLPARVEGEPGLADVLGLGDGAGNAPGGGAGGPPALADQAERTDGAVQTDGARRTGGAELADREGLASLPDNAHLAVGWGAREFYLTTPTWEQLRPGAALRALALAPAALHVEVMPGPPLLDADTRTLHLSRQGYRNLVTFMAASLTRDATGRPMRIAVTPESSSTGYGPDSLFFEAAGRFSPVRTCNTWAAEALAAAGVRTPAWTPLPQFVLYHLPATAR